MRYSIVVAFFFLVMTNAVAAENLNQNNFTEIKYTLSLSFNHDRQKIIARLHNKSGINLQIRRDPSSSSFFAKKIKLFVFQDSESLLRLPSHFSIDPDPDIISIEADGYFEKEIQLGDSKWNYCDILNKTPILIFWFYSYLGIEYGFPLNVGGLRIKKSDVNCKMNPGSPTLG